MDILLMALLRVIFFVRIKRQLNSIDIMCINLEVIILTLSVLPKKSVFYQEEKLAVGSYQLAAVS